MIQGAVQIALMMCVIPPEIAPMDVKQDTGEMFVINNVRISVMETCVIMKMVDVNKDAI